MKWKVLIYLMAACLCCSQTSAATRRALTVFIGEYPKESGWNPTASGNDKVLVLSTLSANGFHPSDIVCIEDSAATYEGIMKALSEMATVAQKGDRIYIHFSCHGQQITDQDGDEALTGHPDRYDEAVVPYDAYIAFGWKGYKGERHLTDDILNDRLRSIRDAVGDGGMLMVVYDACHSGGMERDGKEQLLPPYRGTFDAFEQPLQGRTGKAAVKPVDWISVSACKSFQTNFEVEVGGVRYGRLSYALSRVLKSGMTAESLAEALKTEYKSLPMPSGRSQSPECVIPEKMRSKTLFK